MGPILPLTPPGQRFWPISAHCYPLHPRIANLSPGGLPAIRRYLDENVRSDALAAGLELDVGKWPFPSAVDRPARSGASYPWGFPLGQSQEPYGRIACPTFILIDRSSTIVADSAMRAEDWEAALANEKRTGARGWLGNDDP